MSLALRGSAEVPTGEDKWSHKGPDVKQEADPAGADLDPHSWPLAGHALKLCIRAKKTRESQVEETGLPDFCQPSLQPPAKAKKFSSETWLALPPSRVVEGPEEAAIFSCYDQELKNSLTLSFK